MPTINQYLTYAETALAGYAVNLFPNIVNKNELKTAGMADAEATQFDTTWAVIEQSPSLVNGFSAVLLQNRNTGEKVLAIRGIESSNLGVDYLTDFVDIGVYGSVNAMPQYGSLEAFYQSLISSGKLNATESITVTGHSLGGFLAEAFTARHSGVVGAAYTYNAPGFGGALTQLAAFLGIVDASTVNNKIFNVRATDGISLTAGLGQVMGLVQQVRIEAATANPIYYHSITTLTDTLSIYKVYSDMQSSLTMEQVANIFVGSGLGNRKLENALDAIRAVFLGAASLAANKTPTGNREAFFNNLKELTTNSTFASLVAKPATTTQPAQPSQLIIRLSGQDLRNAARNDFGALIALQDLSPIWITGKDAAADATLATLWQAGHAAKVERMVFECKFHRKYCKKHSDIINKYDGYRHKWHCKWMNADQSGVMA